MTHSEGEHTPTVSRNRERRIWVLFGSPSGVIGLSLTALFLALFVATVFGWLPADPLAQNPSARLSEPSAAYWLGTDQFGRDMFSRVAAGVATSLQVSVTAILIAAVIGIVAGVLAGYFRGWTDGVVRSISDVLLAFPSLLLALAVASVFDRNWLTVSLAIAAVYIPLFIRVARAPVLSLREMEFVVAARVSGMRGLAVLVQHVLPNIANVLIVQATLSLTWAILTEASLSFLGFGTPPPAPSLGVMVQEARSLFTIAPWTLLGPGAALVLLVVGLNLLGDVLQSMLDPRRRAR